ncbi:RING finger protein 227-like [Thamnophis elegans]|uniref:RING finger protein 227-like n=1 Tax=Thamnophis elegans TaxID=35005 RepID=UPI0013786E67|nr:RING finger protein 227-like [Thamnophis elegans]
MSAVEEEVESEGTSELECGICCMPYDRCGRAPRRLGGARGSWKPSRCRHVICSACVCQLAREGWWEEVTCPYCRAVTSLRERGNLLAAGVRRSSGGWRRRLVLPPIDAELWQRVVLREREPEQAARVERLAGDDEEEEEQESGEDVQWRPWRTLKRLLKGGGQAHARDGRGRARGGSGPTWRRRQPINPYGSETKDLALVTCYVI